jgi:hypothetical protein
MLQMKHKVLTPSTSSPLAPRHGPRGENNYFASVFQYWTWNTKIDQNFSGESGCTGREISSRENDQ